MSAFTASEAEAMAALADDVEAAAGACTRVAGSLVEPSPLQEPVVLVWDMRIILFTDQVPEAPARSF
ncbi:hypothetical protein HHA02_03030 [Cobetia marina]|nr:hypothetical protein HHA02_03030 [Cobetia marina]